MSKRMKKALALCLIFSTIFTSSCTEESLDLESDLKVISGQSFGFCIGPCYQTLTIFPNDVNVEFYVKTTDGKGNQGNAEEHIYKDVLSENELSEILEEIDFDAFRKLDERFGCPDCADGGAEWVEIEKDGLSHKVTFEYGKEVKGMGNLILLLRKKRTALSEKYVTYK